MACRLRPLQRVISGQRLYSQLSASEVRALDDWIEHIVTVEHEAEDYLSLTRIRDLYCTLPTRAQSTSQSTSSLVTPDKNPGHGSPLRYGHSLAFFHPHSAEQDLAPDMTDAQHCPPAPFTRRMWAGGEFAWRGAGLRMGHRGIATSHIVKVEKKGFDTASPKVFVHQNVVYKHAEVKGSELFSEKRIHVYLPRDIGADQRVVRVVSDLPEPDFSYSWTPTPTTLFRFSAITFNAHLIHLDKDYAQKQEGYPERLVHGPLTALMLLEGLVYNKPDIRLSFFDYRARNPVLVNRKQTIHGAFDSGRRHATLWAVDDDGVVGMTGKVGITDPSSAT